MGLCGTSWKPHIMDHGEYEIFCKDFIASTDIQDFLANARSLAGETNWK